MLSYFATKNNQEWTLQNPEIPLHLCKIYIIQL